MYLDSISIGKVGWMETVAGSLWSYKVEMLVDAGTYQFHERKTEGGEKRGNEDKEEINLFI